MEIVQHAGPVPIHGWVRYRPWREDTPHIMSDVHRKLSLQWRHNGRDSVSNHQPHDCLLNGLFRRRSKKTSKLHVTGLCVRNSPGTGEFPAQMASNAENVSIWWRHHDGWHLHDETYYMWVPGFIRFVGYVVLQHWINTCCLWVSGRIQYTLTRVLVLHTFLTLHTPPFTKQ